MRKLIGYLTGGRPMYRVEYLFTDIVSGEGVILYQDTFGRRWMANHCWSLFRVEHS